MDMDWELVFLAASVVFAGAGVFFSGYQTRQTRRQIKRDLDWKRGEAALAYSLSKNQTVRDARLFLDEHFGRIFYEIEPLSIEEFKGIVNENRRFYTNASMLLSHYDSMALGMRMGIVDDRVAYRLYANTVVETVKVFGSFIAYRQEMRNPRAWEHLCECSRQWERDLNDSRTRVELRSILED